jgi:phosphopantothenoylcysteine decarboxylase/phosphopantothenate--cysteine ligase
MDHIHLARWANIVVAAPATSNLINKLAAGIADDVVTSLWQAAFAPDKPMLVVPAMNTHMWSYPATQDSVRRLQSWGVQVLPTGEGVPRRGRVAHALYAGQRDHRRQLRGAHAALEVQRGQLRAEHSEGDAELCGRQARHRDR